MGKENKINVTHATVRNSSSGGPKPAICRVLRLKPRNDPITAKGSHLLLAVDMAEGAGNAQVNNPKYPDGRVFVFKRSRKIHCSWTHKKLAVTDGPSTRFTRAGVRPVLGCHIKIKTTSVFCAFSKGTPHVFFFFFKVLIIGH